MLHRLSCRAIAAIHLRQRQSHGGMLPLRGCGGARSVSWRGRAGFAALVVISLAAATSSAFELSGHEAIEATAYKRLLSWPQVPGTGPPGVSGRALLAALVVDG